ncbi:protein of unknown function [Pseudorhizobium banfieldiae]|uniref:Uncharacterized protein n=1 Tax=Pseudorhizobium banfieldiae TaxID=1125847 RepID=L0NFX8_9HYPH|nr:protein of unknown function [Pseudorhizobium banfieldiae]
MTEGNDQKDTALDAGKSLGSGLDEIGWQANDLRIMLKPRPLRPRIRRYCVTPAGDEQV